MNMKKSKLTVFTAVLATAVISGVCTAYADITEASVNEKNILTIEGITNAENTPVTLEIFESGKNTADVNFSALTDTFYYLREIVSGSDCSYKLELPLKGVARQFKVRVKEGKSAVSEKTVDFKNDAAAAAFNELKAASDISGVKAAADKFLAATEFDFDLYTENKTEIENSDSFYAVIKSAKNDITSQDDLTAAAEYAAVLYALGNAGDVGEFKTIFNQYSKQVFAYDSAVEELFNNRQCASDSVRNDIMQRLYNKKSDKAVFADKVRFRTGLCDSVVTGCCKNNPGYTSFGGIIDALAKIYGNDSEFIGSYNKYKAFSQTKKNEIALEINGNEFASALAARNKFVSAVADSGKSNTGTTGGGGGGGGGSFSGFKASGNTANSQNSENTAPEFSVNIPERKSTSAEFADLDSVPWAKDSITELAEREILSGREENIFAPLDYVTREEFIKILVSALGISTDNHKCSFNDVAEDSWCYRYVAAGFANGIVNGIDDLSFGCGRYVSRQDIAAMLGRAMKKAGFNISAASDGVFEDDNAISEYARESIYALKAAGIINGKENNMFDPQGSTTRAEAAKLISSMIGYIEAN